MPADTYTTDGVGALLMGTGNDTNLWGANANSQDFQILVDAIANILNVSLTGGTLDLSTTPPPAAPSLARYAAIAVFGTLVSNQIIKVPNLNKFWKVRNSTSGNFTLTIKTAGANLVAVIPQGAWCDIWCDGNDNIFTGTPTTDNGPSGTIFWAPAGGTADAIAVTYVPPILGLTDGQICYVRAGAANATTTPTLVVNGLAAHTITRQGGVALQVGDIAGSGAELILRYNGNTLRFELLNPAVGLGPGGIPLLPPGVVVDFAGGSAPTGWLLCAGQAVSRATFAGLFATVGTVYGVGDGSTTFNLPDYRGRTGAGKDDMNGSAASRITTLATDGGTITGSALGSAGGSQNHALATAELPSHTHGFTTGNSDQSLNHHHSTALVAGGQQGNTGGAAAIAGAGVTGDTDLTAHTHSGTTNAAGSNAATAILQPTIIVNKIIKT